ncbi:MAG: TIGR02186 family protein [Pseudomonadota bacterium]
MDRIFIAWWVLAAGLVVLCERGLAHSDGVDRVLEVGLDSDLVAIDLEFSGTELTVFGSAPEGTEPVIVIRGPAQTFEVWRKERIFGLWINRNRHHFDHVPSYYRIAHLEDRTPAIHDSVARHHQIGLDHVLIFDREGQARPFAHHDYTKALYRRMRAQELFSETPAVIHKLGSHLFRADFTIPANVLPGTYHVEAFLIQDGRVVAAQTTPLFVKKVGMGWNIYAYAHDSSVLYGLAAVLIAFLFGITANWLFRARR